MIWSRISFVVSLFSISHASIVHLESYPDYTGNISVVGTVSVIDSDDGGIEIEGTLGGLEENVFGGIHIHSGYTCDEADDVGGHYFEGMDVDPWTTNYESDENGVSYVSFSMESFSLYEDFPVAKRALVIHSEDGTRIACGLLQTGETATASLLTYPGYSGNISVVGTVSVIDSNGGIELEGALGGLEENVFGGIHIHSGYTCENASEVGGHYFEGMDVDPWTTNYESDENGVSYVSFSMESFSLQEDFPVAKRALVIHSEDGTRIACGLLDLAVCISCPTTSRQLLFGTMSELCC